MKKKRPTHKEGAGDPPRTKLQDEPLHKVSLIFDFVQFSLAKCLASLVVGDGWVGGLVGGLLTMFGVFTADIDAYMWGWGIVLS